MLRFLSKVFRTGVVTVLAFQDNVHPPFFSHVAEHGTQNAVDNHDHDNSNDNMLVRCDFSCPCSSLRVASRSLDSGVLRCYLEETTFWKQRTSCTVCQPMAEGNVR